MGRNLKIGDMKVEISWNKLDDSWWLDLGVSWTEAYYNFNEDGKGLGHLPMKKQNVIVWES